MEIDRNESVATSISILFFRICILRDWRIEHCAGEGSNFKEVVILELISQFDGITGAGLSKFLNQNQSSVKEVLDPLVERGFVQKEETQGGRNIPLKLTPIGLKKLEGMRRLFAYNIADRMIVDLSQDDLSIVLNAMEILLQKANLQFKELF